MNAFRQRRLVPEIMDQPGLAPERHRAALRGLARINFLSGSTGILWPALRDLAREMAPKPIRVLDVATGGGDVPVKLWHKATHLRIPMTVEGCDLSATALAHAQETAQASGADVRFFQHNALSGPLPKGYDAITCSLFLHHVTQEEALELLSRMASAAGRLVLVNDLARSATGWTLAWAGTRILSRCDVVHSDGPQSVCAAFTLDEARTMAEKAGLRGATVARRFPFRWLLKWRRV